MSLLFTSLWLGVLTSISPCPLTSNIAAISFLGKQVNRPYYVLYSGLFYSLGRVLLYVVLGLILTQSISVVPIVSDFLQSKIFYFVAPIMILIGFVLLDIIKFSIPTFNTSRQIEKVQKFGLLGAFLIGILFAMSFCPVSAALYFSTLISSNGDWMLLFAYGVGTGLPVILFAFILAFASNKISQFYKVTTLFEKYARKITGIIFIVIGFYYFWRIL